MKPDTNLRINLEDLYRFKALAAKRRATMKALFAAVCDMLENEQGDDTPIRQLRTWREVRDERAANDTKENDNGN